MLTQNEADHLIAMKKSFSNSELITFSPGTDSTFNLIGDDEHEHFLFDLWRGTIRLSKLKYQTRGRKSIVLVRLDINGAPHTNPDSVKIGGTHIHIYREGFEDKWAYPLEKGLFPHTNDIGRTLEDFCAYCNIDNLPPYQVGLNDQE